jgi:ABC-type polysaccharide transport system permease subunit
VADARTAALVIHNFSLCADGRPCHGFQDYSPLKGILGSRWVGFQYFQMFFTNPSFTRTVFNTFYLSFLTLIFGFPAPIIIALLILRTGTLMTIGLEQLLQRSPLPA